MFKNVTYFRIASDFAMPSTAALEEVLRSHAFVPCGPTEPESSGWLPPRGNLSDVLLEKVGQHFILRLCTERRPLPASAVAAAVDERIKAYKQETGRERVNAKLKREFKEEAIQTLLPRAFTKRTSTTLWLDSVNKFLFVDTANLAGADKIVSFLVEALGEVPGARPGIAVKPVQTALSAASSMSHWLSTREAPHNFTVDRHCELKMPDDQKSAVRYSRHTLEIDEVAQHIASGKVPTLLGMTWNGRVSFELVATGQIRRIELLDVVLDGQGDRGAEDDGFDADVAILTGELSALLPDLLEAHGGELRELGASN